MDTIHGATSERPFSTADLMARWGYSEKSKRAFWDFVRRQGVPHVKLTERKLIFPRPAVIAWEQTRTVGKVAAA